jgi:suppressor of G2 allele of SKP1
VSGLKWSALESSEPITQNENEKTIATPAPAPASTPSTAAQGPSYPTSSRKGPKNWDAVVSEELSSKNEAGEDEFQEEGDHVNAFFKKLYKDADPDTRRAMMKSFQESNGTSLSTNWSEVQNKKFETQPPEGVEAKPWN